MEMLFVLWQSKTDNMYRSNASCHSLIMLKAR